MKNIFEHPLAKQAVVIALLMTTSFASHLNANSTIESTRTTVLKWIDLEKAISQEALDWEMKNAHLTDMIQLLKVDIELMESQVEKNNNRSTSTDKKRKELLTQKEEVQLLSTTIKQSLNEFESQINSLKPRLARPLVTRLQPFFQRISPKTEPTTLGIAERMQSVIAILSAIHKFNETTTLSREIRILESSKKGEVKTLYLGLGSAYYLSTNEKEGGYGVPNEEGWEWHSTPKLIPQLKETFKIAENTTQEAKFISLPVSLPQK